VSCQPETWNLEHETRVLTLRRGWPNISVFLLFSGIFDVLQPSGAQFCIIGALRPVKGRIEG